MEIQYELTHNPVSFNESDLVAFIDDFLSVYENFIVTPENLVDTKKDMANLNKFNQSLETTRKTIKKEILKPYDEFEKIVKREVSKVQEVRTSLDIQVKAIENAEKEKKRVEIQALIQEVQQEKNCFFDVPIEEEWLNKTTKIKVVRGCIETRIMEYQLAQFSSDDTIEKSIKITYKTSQKALLTSLFQQLKEQGIEYEFIN